MAHDRIDDTSSGLGALLRGEHTRLDATFDALASGFSADPWSAGLTEWKHFEAALLAHMNIEEDLLLPVLARSHPDEAARIREEHASIRRDLDELGLGVELHLISADLIERFIEKLRAHAEREDAMLYRFADRELDTATKTGVLARIRAAAARLAGARAS